MDHSLTKTAATFLEIAFPVTVIAWLVWLTRRASARERQALRDRDETLEIAQLLARDEWQVGREDQYDQEESEHLRDDVWASVLGIHPTRLSSAAPCRSSDIPGFFTGWLTRDALVTAQATTPGTRVRFSVKVDHDGDAPVGQRLRCEVLEAGETD